MQPGVLAPENGKSLTYAAVSCIDITDGIPRVMRGTIAEFTVE